MLDFLLNLSKDVWTSSKKNGRSNLHHIPFTSTYWMWQNVDNLDSGCVNEQ